jgi:nitroimidazol reductase NimA-like FMN-containing flavoprotein (pyridoxamine 5'-phosphate oxidase superfamily)
MKGGGRKTGAARGGGCDTAPVPRLFQPTDRTRVRRNAVRAVYDRDLVEAVLDEALVCHVGFVDDGQPVVLPTIHARVGDTLYLHGAVGNAMLRAASAGTRLCVTVTLVDGIVLARSAFKHSMNYRCVVVFGQGREVTDAAERALALDALVEHVAPGRSAEARGPNQAELLATRVVAVPLDEVSAKVRTGPPLDEPEDLSLPVWAGVLPLALVPGPPEPDPQVAAGTEVAASAASWRRPRSST